MSTNITDFDPATGHTTTTLVTSHDRGSTEYNTRIGQELDTDEQPLATGATAGIPGTWTPSGSRPPSGPGAPMVGITASPTSAWTSGQFVQTATIGAAGRVTWTGSAWVGGVAP